jgi:hypothetical protein
VARGGAAPICRPWPTRWPVVTLGRKWNLASPDECLGESIEVVDVELPARQARNQLSQWRLKKSFDCLCMGGRNGSTLPSSRLSLDHHRDHKKRQWPSGLVGQLEDQGVSVEEATGRELLDLGVQNGERRLV